MKISQAEYDALESKLILKFASQQTAKVLHQMVMEWNWDCSDDFLHYLVHTSSTDKATILMIYWKSAPKYVKQFKDRNDILNKEPFYIHSFDLVEKIEKNYINDFYKKSNFEFDPGFWTEEYPEIKTINSIPKIMYHKINGETVQQPINFTEGCPLELYESLGKLYETYH